MQTPAVVCNIGAEVAKTATAKDHVDLEQLSIRQLTRRNARKRTLADGHQCTRRALV